MRRLELAIARSEMVGDRRAEPPPVGTFAKQGRVAKGGEEGECSVRYVVLIEEVASPERELEALPCDSGTRAQEMPGTEPVQIVGGDELTVGHIEACSHVPPPVARPAAVQGCRQSQGIARSERQVVTAHIWHEGICYCARNHIADCRAATAEHPE